MEFHFCCLKNLWLHTARCRCCCYCDHQWASHAERKCHLAFMAPSSDLEVFANYILSQSASRGPWVTQKNFAFDWANLYHALTGDPSAQIFAIRFRQSASCLLGALEWPQISTQSASCLLDDLEWHQIFEPISFMGISNAWFLSFDSAKNRHRAFLATSRDLKNFANLALGSPWPHFALWPSQSASCFLGDLEWPRS